MRFCDFDFPPLIRVEKAKPVVVRSAEDYDIPMPTLNPRVEDKTNTATEKGRKLHIVLSPVTTL